MKFTVTDSSPIQSVTVDQGNLKQEEDGSYTLKLSLEGKNVYTIKATDAIDNYAVTSITYYLDKTNPAIGEMTVDENEVTFTVTDSLSGIVTNSITAVNKADSNDKKDVTSTTGDRYTFTGEAGKTYMVTAMDGAGNTAQASVSIPQDTTTTPQPPHRAPSP